MCSEKTKIYLSLISDGKSICLLLVNLDVPLKNKYAKS